MKRLLAVALLCAPALATALEPLGDAALARVVGRDGMSFNLSGFSVSGNATLRYTTGDNSGSFSIGNLAASRSDNADAPFADPYRFDIFKGSGGRADIINLARPLNATGRELWQVAYDFGVRANGLDVNGGSLILKDLAYYGGGLQWSTPASGEGLAFGSALRSELGSLTLQPNGRDGGAEALTLSGLRIGAATAGGAAPTTPWRIADVTSQPGIFNAVTDAAGNARLHLGIGWPDAGGAALGTLQVDNISFRSDVTGITNLGAARIGSLQLQYLDIKFHP
jgi:hypothetical protein